MGAGIIRSRSLCPDKLPVLFTEDGLTVEVVIRALAGLFADESGDGPGQDQAPRIINEPLLRSRVELTPFFLNAQSDHSCLPGAVLGIRPEFPARLKTRSGFLKLSARDVP